jgi:hypothetical protein
MRVPDDRDGPRRLIPSAQDLAAEGQRRTPQNTLVSGSEEVRVANGFTDISDASVMWRVVQNLWVTFWKSERPHSSIRWVCATMVALTMLGVSCWRSRGLTYEDAVPLPPAFEVPVPHQEYPNWVGRLLALLEMPRGRKSIMCPRL